MTNSHEFLQNFVDEQKRSMVYIDSPMPNAVHQVLPFMGDGILGGGDVSLVVRKRSTSPWYWFQRQKKTVDLTKVTLSQWASTVPENTVIYYPFNAQANMRLVSNRKLRHVLVLHGESNKIASYRPASRLYDYIVVAGELACRRYIRAGVFTNAEVNGGRLIRMGDSFVQDYPYLVATPQDGDGYVLYAPTWETSTPSENYSSAENGFGFNLTLDCAKALNKNAVMIKLHPNYGTRSLAYVKHLVAGLRNMIAAGLTVQVVDDAVSSYVRFVLVMLFGRNIMAPTSAPIPVNFAITDISGMEAVLLKQRIPHMVITKNNFLEMPDDPDLSSIYEKKALIFEEDRNAFVDKIGRYYQQSEAVDAEHRNLIFSYSDGSMATMSPHDRFMWLENYVRNNQYWK